MTTTTTGVVIVEKGAAIVTAERDEADGLLVTGIERHPFALSTVVDRVRELDGDERRFVIDHEGLGRALWAALGPPEDEQRWALYEGRGIERQALVDALLVAIHQGRFHFAPKLGEQAAMNKALGAYRRQVADDGLIGSELVVALLLAITEPEPPLIPFVLFEGGRS